jgi:Cu+-exporting ATPase
MSVTGMNCSNCARHVTEAIQSVPGVQSAQVNLEAHDASVRWRDGVAPSLPAVMEAVHKAGYTVSELQPEEHAHHNHAADTVAGWQLNLWIGVLGTAPLMIGEWLFHLESRIWFAWFSFIVGTIVQIFAGGPFYRGAWRQLRIGSSNMDTLVALGSTTAFAYSTWALLTSAGGHLYFMEAAAIITLVSVGHWMESRVIVRASSALRELMNLAPSRATRRDPDGTEREIPVSDLRPGDVVVLRPGDHVPTDGEVMEGGSAVDESMLTGESAPIEKSAGKSIYSGTVCLDGRLLARVTATGEATALAQVIAAVQRAQNSRAEIERLGDRVSNVFVPLVISIALAAGLWWDLAPEKAAAVAHALGHYLWAAHPPSGLAAGFIVAAAVLIVACPCAMGLATPAAIMAGANAAARRGILIRDGVALERAGNVTTVLFDKTGTLTVGKPTVAEVWTNPTDLSSCAVDPVSLAGRLAARSRHPVSQAIAAHGSSTPEIEDWQELRGSGLRGRVGKATVLLGSLRWLREEGVDVAQADAFRNEWAAQAATTVGFAVDGSLHALFAVRDTLKTGAAEVVRSLKGQGMRVYLVTGDTALTATTLAKEADIPADNVFAEVRPEQKAEIVRRLQSKGDRVAFVGDGINDAPALEQADLGIAVTRASDIAREAADIILLKSDIQAVPESIGLARATLRTIKQNLFWAFFYNAAGIPLAALGFMSPVLCAAAMGLSDLVVIGNALRLRKWRPRMWLGGPGVSGRRSSAETRRRE